MNIIENTKYCDRFILLRRQGWGVRDISKKIFNNSKNLQKSFKHFQLIIILYSQIFQKSFKKLSEIIQNTQGEVDAWKELKPELSEETGANANIMVAEIYIGKWKKLFEKKWKKNLIDLGKNMKSPKK